MYMKRQSEFFPIFKKKRFARCIRESVSAKKRKNIVATRQNPWRIEKAGNGEQAEFTLVSPLAWLLSVCVRLTN